MNEFAQYPMAIAALFFIIKMLLDYIKEIKLGKNGDSKEDCNNTVTKQFIRDFYELKNEIKDLHEWHNKEDEDGRKIWYVKASLEKSIVELNENMKQSTEVLKGLTELIRRIESE